MPTKSNTNRVWRALCVGRVKPRNKLNRDYPHATMTRALRLKPIRMVATCVFTCPGGHRAKTAVLKAEYFSPSFVRRFSSSPRDPHYKRGDSLRGALIENRIITVIYIKTQIHLDAGGNGFAGDGFSRSTQWNFYHTLALGLFVGWPSHRT